ncbi:hypothetical protein A1D23_12415 [Chelonobacter oris]|uniref:hypothetical protein n=1 Tax=Chelonobacter oris TaxID=505317 RepID=UPI00244C8CA0|nr:hypothetical protein [Chelonobacter oris]MDH3001322.1 hypothetical protein [Chelonobacter oris]
MNNIGYKLGKLVLSYKKWRHPLLLKTIYGLITFLLFAIITGFIMTIIAGIAILLYLITTNNICTSPNDNKDDEDGWRYGYSGFGYYVNGYRIDHDE